MSVDDDDDDDQNHLFSFQFSWAASAVLGRGLRLCAKGVSHHPIAAPADPEEDTRYSSSSVIQSLISSELLHA